MISHRTFWTKNWRPAIWHAQHCPTHIHPRLPVRHQGTPPVQAPPARPGRAVAPAPSPWSRGSTTCATPTPPGCWPPASRSTSSRPDWATSRSRPPSTSTAAGSPTPNSRPQTRTLPCSAAAPAHGPAASPRSPATACSNSPARSHLKSNVESSGARAVVDGVAGRDSSDQPDEETAEGVLWINTRGLWTNLEFWGNHRLKARLSQENR